MKDIHFEIERKYLIRMPDAAWLRAAAESSEITQTYLLCEPGTTERVRRRGKDGAYVCTHTVKRKLSDMRRIEDEEEISAEEYGALLERADPERRTIAKTRWVLPYEGQLFELDVFPFWDDRAYLEIELKDEAQEVMLPPQIRVIREVTDDERYTNASLSKEIPYEDIGKE